MLISGFAKFARVDRAARMGRNPQTGEAIRIKASRKARVTPLKAFKDAVLTGKAPGQEGTGQEGRAREEGRRQEGSRPRRPRPRRRRLRPRRPPAKKAVARKAPAKKTAAKKTTRR